MSDKKITELTGYTPAIDTDVIPIVDITTLETKKITWANIKSTLKTYLDTLYATISHNHTGTYEPVKGADDNYVTDAEKIVIGNTSGTNSGDNATNSQYSGLASSKQDALVSGTNIKTINSTSLLGSGNIDTPNTTYVASDFDIKDLTDSTNLRSSWTGKQAALNGTGFVKASGTTISYDNSTYLTSVEGTAVKSTGEAGGTKFLREDGDGTCSWQTVSGGTVTSVSVTSANGVSGTVATETTTPAITLDLGDITPTSVVTDSVETEICPALSNSGTDWSFGDGWAYSAPNMVKSAGSVTGALTVLTGTLTIGRVYKVVISYTDLSVAVSPTMGSVFLNAMAVKTSTATTVTSYITAISTNKLTISLGAATTAIITAISIKEITGGLITTNNSIKMSGSLNSAEGNYIIKAAPLASGANGGAAVASLISAGGITGTTIYGSTSMSTPLINQPSDSGYAQLALSTTVNKFSRNIADAYATLTIESTHASATGKILSIDSAAGNPEITVAKDGTLELGTNNITMSGSIGVTGTRVTKGWFTDIESTNMPTVGGSAILTSLTAPQFTTIELGHASDTTIARVSAGVVSIEGKNILTTDGGTLTGNITLGENTGIALDPAGSADEKWSGITCTGTAGETIAVGDLVYLDATAGEWKLADADAASTSGDVPLAMCLLAANDGGATNLLLNGTIRSAAFPASIALGAPVYVSTTAGDITATQPSGTDDVIRRVGWAITTEPNTIYFNPSNDYITHT